MIDDWFRPIELTIPFSVFATLPRHAAYKYEYFDGRAVLTPRPRHLQATVDLALFQAVKSPFIRQLQPQDWPHVADLHAAAFRHVPPFGALDDPSRVDAARASLARTRAADDGAVLDAACMVAVDPDDDRRLAGAIIITSLPGGGEQRPHLTWIMVHPWRFGQGLGSQLLASSATALREVGYRELRSTFLVGNERSALWHWRNGFRLESNRHGLRL